MNGSDLKRLSMTHSGNLVYGPILIPCLRFVLTALYDRLLPLMISRLMLSLKKASRSKGSGWTSDALSRTHFKTDTRIEFGDPPEGGGGTTSGEVALSDLSTRQDRGRNDEEIA